tara:strand:+ start:434 stop:1219 length:786 start_codon:yes stop_codon:yes gene_type:complete
MNYIDYQKKFIIYINNKMENNSEYYYQPSTQTNSDCNPYYLLNNFIYHEFGNGEKAIKFWPKSIGGQYSKYKRQTERTKRAKNDIHFSVGDIQHDVLSNCVNNILKDFSHLFSKEKNCCIHLRLGDAMNPHFWKNEHHDYSYAPFKEIVVYQSVKKSVPKDYTINIMYSSTAGGTVITEDIIKSSNQYVKNLTDLLKIDYQNINCFDNSHADIDFCRAIHSDIFISGVGGFTNLIVNHRKFRKLINIKLKGETLDPNTTVI